MADFDGSDALICRRAAHAYFPPHTGAQQTGCDMCGESVWIAPSSLELIRLRANTDGAKPVIVVCMECARDHVPAPTVAPR